jgi:hypothetical protein
MDQQLLAVGLILLFAFLFIFNGPSKSLEKYGSMDPYYQWRTYNYDPPNYGSESQYPFDYKPKPFFKRFDYYNPYFRKYGYGNY